MTDTETTTIFDPDRCLYKDEIVRCDGSIYSGEHLLFRDCVIVTGQRGFTILHGTTATFQGCTVVIEPAPE